MLRLVLNYAAKSLASAMLLLAASPAMAQVAAPLAPDSEWRSAPKPQLRPEVKQYIAVNPSVPAEGAELPVWSLEVSDTTLSNTLSRWSRQVKWQLLWEADRDFPILANVYLKGSFESAILSVMQSLSDSDYPLQAIINMDRGVDFVQQFSKTWLHHPRAWRLQRGNAMEAREVCAANFAVFWVLIFFDI